MNMFPETGRRLAVLSRLVPLLLLLLFAPGGRAAMEFGAAPEFLPVDEAFPLGGDFVGARIAVFWQTPPGYYLYRHRFEFTLVGEADAGLIGEAVIPPGKQKTDEYFGEVEVYYGDLRVEVPVLGPLPDGATLEVRYQGCADAGLCYPPQRRYLALTGAAAGSIGKAPPAAPEPAAAAATVAASTDATPAAVPPPESDDATLVTEESRLAALLTDASLPVALLVFFVAGIGLAFTPCVLPMVPILSSIIAGEGDITRARAALLSVTYVLAMAVTYAALGTVVGMFGGALNIHGWLQSPPVLVTFALLFVVLSLSMFGFYELQLPAALRDRLQSAGGSGGKLTGVALMGVFSSLLVSPCVSAPLAGALIAISTTGDALLGGTALFALALGMGVPLLLVGIGGGALLPRAGGWMNAVKSAFGVLLLGVAVWLVERVVSPGVAMLMWAALAIGSGVALGALDFSPREGIGNLWKASGAMLFVYGVLLLIGVASGATDPLRPLARIAETGSLSVSEQEAEFVAVDDAADVAAQLRLAGEAGQPVLLDLYADWCISCKVMERQVFPQPEVQRLMGRFRLLRADVTANDARHRDLLAQYGLFGPPSLLFFDPEGRELKAYRLQGEIGAEDFSAHLRAVLAAAG